ncbi:MAG: nucleoside hydrolase [Lachnospirales bacterium]
METKLKMLKHPKGIVDVVLDTDTYNEVDDQFALAYLIKSNDKLNLKAINAAPFYFPQKNNKSDSPKDGMLKSYKEIIKILKLMKAEKYIIKVCKGSENFLKDEYTPEISEAVTNLVDLSKNYSSDNPLYIISIGAITNIASAILMDKTITERIVVIWLGGSALHWIDNNEFNLIQDIAAARVVFLSGVPLVQLPCQGVIDKFAVSGIEIDYYLSNKNDLCNYLANITKKEGKKESNIYWTRVIWDVTAVAWLINENFLLDKIIHTPLPEYDGYYSFDDRRHFYKYVYHVNRDLLIKDLFEKLLK